MKTLVRLAGLLAREHRRQITGASPRRTVHLLAKCVTSPYSCRMGRRRSFRALLLLLTAVAPLQAQSMFACAMMDTVVLDPCCCDQHHTKHLDSVTPDPQLGLEACEDPCCERSVRVTVDQDPGQATPIVKSAESRSEIDPHQPIACAMDSLIRPQRIVTPRLDHPFPAAGRSGSDTWLITGRLRI